MDSQQMRSEVVSPGPLFGRLLLAVPMVANVLLPIALAVDCSLVPLEIIRGAETFKGARTVRVCASMRLLMALCVFTVSC